MATLCALAVAADRKICVLRERRKQFEQPLGTRLAHLVAIPTRKRAPARLRPRRAERPADERLARREIGQPNVVVVAPRIVGLAYAARRTACRADAQAFTSYAWTS